MKTTPEEKLLRRFLPGYDWDRFEVIGYDIVENTDPNSKVFYPERMIVTIQEKNIVPQDVWPPDEYYPHWFLSPKTYNDYPARWTAMTIKEKKRRRKHRKTWKTTVSIQETTPIESWTKAPSDLLYFLK